MALASVVRKAGAGSPHASRWRTAAAALALAALGALAYGNALTGQFIGIDTLQNVRDNPDIRSLTPLSRALSLHRGRGVEQDDSTLIRRPVLSLSFALNHALLGPDALGFQLVNIAIHVAAALCLFGIAGRTLRLTGYAGESRASVLGFVIAALWLVHPLQTEAVTNIIQRAESLMGLFALLTLYGSIRYGQAGAGPARCVWTGVALAACALGMGTKEVMVVMPAIVVLYDLLLVRGSARATLHRRWRLYLALAATYVVPAALLAATAPDAMRDFDGSRAQLHLLSQPRVILHYLRLVVWPDPLFHHIRGTSFYFDPAVDPWLDFVRYALPLAALVTMVAIAVLRRSPWGFLGLAFFLPLMPTSLLTTFGVIQEHRMYLPLAPAIAAVVLAAEAWLPAGHRRWPATIRGVLVAVALVGLVHRTQARNLEYRSDLTLWAPEELPLAYAMLTGLAVFQRGDLAEGATLLEALLGAPAAGFPDQLPPLRRAPALNALGVVYTLQGRWQQARSAFADAIREDPSYALAKSNLATTALLAGDRQAALGGFERALALQPDLAVAELNRDLIAHSHLDSRAAFRHLRRVTTHIPMLQRDLDRARAAASDDDPATTRIAVALALPDDEFSFGYKLVLIPETEERANCGPEPEPRV